MSSNAMAGFFIIFLIISQILSHILWIWFLGIRKGRNNRKGGNIEEFE